MQKCVGSYNFCCKGTCITSPHVLLAKGYQMARPEPVGWRSIVLPYRGRLQVKRNGQKCLILSKKKAEHNLGKITIYHISYKKLVYTTGRGGI